MFVYLRVFFVIVCLLHCACVCFGLSVCVCVSLFPFAHYMLSLFVCFIVCLCSVSCCSLFFVCFVACVCVGPLPVAEWGNGWMG